MKFNVAELTIVMSRCPAVILAVSRTPRASGRISRLIVSIIIINGISAVGEPSGSMWARVIDGFFAIPVITVASHIGMAMAMFIDSWEVVVKVYGRSPIRFDRRITIKRLVRMWHHFCPTGVSWLVIFCMTVFRNQEMAVAIRFPSSLGLWWISIIGINIESGAVGVNSSSGLENCSNMFMFMVG